jgi:hypothetical protein
MLAGEEAWAEAQFARSHWNQDAPECAECGGEVEDGECLKCGAQYMSKSERKETAAAEAADHYNDQRSER